MTCFAVARLTNVRMGPDIVEYLEKIDETLRRFNGHFVIHGGPVDLLEGDWTGDLIVIAFPDRQHAQAWYSSPGYRAIAPLRTENSTSEVILIDGVPDNHKATDVLVQPTSPAPPPGPLRP